LIVPISHTRKHEVTAVPMELRKIFFSSEEVEVAATSYCINSGKPLPSADRLYATFKDDIEAMVTLHFCRSGRCEPVTVSLTRAEVSDALIHFCKEIGVPLPRAGKKVLWPQGNGISLMVTLEAFSTRVIELRSLRPTSSRESVANDQLG
jgi:hypothetical protein